MNRNKIVSIIAIAGLLPAVYYTQGFVAQYDLPDDLKVTEVPPGIIMPAERVMSLPLTIAGTTSNSSSTAAFIPFT